MGSSVWGLFSPCSEGRIRFSYKGREKTGIKQAILIFDRLPVCKFHPHPLQAPSAQIDVKYKFIFMSEMGLENGTPFFQA